MMTIITTQLFQHSWVELGDKLRKENNSRKHIPSLEKMFFWSFNFATNLSLWTLQFYTTRKVGKMWKIFSILWIWKATVIIPNATLHTYRIFKKSSFENFKLTKRICTIQQDFKRHNLMPYPCSHFYFDIKFGNRLYSKEKGKAWPVLFWL